MIEVLFVDVHKMAFHKKFYCEEDLKEYIIKHKLIVADIAYY
jgi:hypothetical protein